MNRFTRIVAAAAFSCTSVFAFAGDDCDISINYDLVLEPDNLQVITDDQTRYQFSDGELRINDKKIALTAGQRELVARYEQQVATQVPQVVALVNDTLVLTGEALSLALTPLLGDSSSAQLAALMNRVEDRMALLASRNGDTYRLGVSGTSIDEAFGEEFEQEMEQLIIQSIGSIMMNIGAQMLQADGDTLEAKLNSMSEKMDNIGNEIDAAMTQRGDAIEERANAMCQDMKQIATLEAQLRRDIPQLADFRLTESDSRNM
ncbi:YggN family protein [Shewanella sp. GXUN23E]|uniref:YggN family protein n=1 Tax=Shewanella sp. GXUN23E TaxID=3422498 RepID=UPI003D7DF94F